MKKIVLTLLIAMGALLISNCVSSSTANPDEVSLNTAIRDAAARMESRLDRGTKVALINFTSPSQAFSEYVLDELSSVLVNSGHLVVVDRANLDRIRQELGFNMSGEVSDQSMQAIGQMLGAQALVTGSLASIGDLRRIMFKTIMTETAAVVVQHPADIMNDRRVQALLASGAASAGGGSSGVAGGGANSGGGSSGGNRGPEAQPATPAATGYRIGDTGPAGGLVFYDKGNNISGWRYLEAAPANTEVVAVWGSNGRSDNRGSIPNEVQSQTKETIVGGGKYNTEALITWFNATGGGFDMAAWVCNNLNVNGVTDWYLPSRDELHWMYGNLHRQSLGGFRNAEYWTSTDYDYNEVYYENFTDGIQGHNYIWTRYRVRAIRRF